MTKDELKRMKKKLETKVYIEDAYSGSKALSLFELEQRINTIAATENVKKYFESIIKYFSLKGVKYDEIVLKPFYSLIIKEKDLDDNTVIKENAKPLSKLVVVKINGFYCKNKENKIYDDPDIIFSDNYEEFVVILEDFIDLIEKNGFIYNGLKSIQEIQEEIIAGRPTVSDITLSLKKNLIKVK